MAYTFRNFDLRSDTCESALIYRRFHIAHHLLTNGDQNFTWLWSRLGTGPGYRGALTIAWRRPRLLWRPTMPAWICKDQRNTYAARSWTGRTRECIGIDWALKIYLRSPGGFERSWAYGSLR